MAPFTSSQLLMLSVPAIAVLLNYLWYKKKRIGARSDPGDKETDRINPSVDTEKNTSEPVDIGSKSCAKKALEASSAPSPLQETPSKTFSRSFSAPIPIILPKERRLSNSYRASEEELDRQIQRIKPSEKISNPFDKIKLRNSLSPSLKSNDCKSVSPLSKTESVEKNRAVGISKIHQEIIQKTLCQEDILEEKDIEITVTPQENSFPNREIPTCSESALEIESDSHLETPLIKESEIEETSSEEETAQTIKEESLREEPLNNNIDIQKFKEFSAKMTSTTNTEICQESIPSNTEPVEIMCNTDKDEQVMPPAVLKNDDTSNMIEDEKDNRTTEERPCSSEEGSCSTEDRHSSADERPSSTEPVPDNSKGAIPKKNKKKKFRKLDCDLKDLGKKLRVTKVNEATAAPENKKNGQKSRSDSGCEREETNAHSSGRQSANESPSDTMMAVSSSLTSLNESEGSNDSGKGCSDVNTPPPQANATVEEEEENTLSFYEFLISKNLVGKLIGKKGSFVNSVYTRTNAHLVVKDHPFNEEEKVCIVEGTKEAIANAMRMVKQRFPKEKLKQFLPKDCVPPPLSIEHVVSLPGGLNVESYMSCVLAPNHFYIQQPANPTYPNYLYMHSLMNDWYNSQEAPSVPTPLTENILCVAFTQGYWARVWVMSVDAESEMACVKCLDLGGYLNVPFSDLKQIKHEYICLPFQANECILSNIEMAEDEWPQEAYDLIRTLTTNCLVYTHVVSITEDNIPEVNCQVIIDNKAIWINRELVKRGYARWINPIPPYGATVSPEN